jgi:hypothetical protein
MEPSVSFDDDSSVSMEESRRQRLGLFGVSHSTIIRPSTSFTPKLPDYDGPKWFELPETEASSLSGKAPKLNNASVFSQSLPVLTVRREIQSADGTRPRPLPSYIEPRRVRVRNVTEDPASPMRMSIAKRKNKRPKTSEKRPTRIPDAAVPSWTGRGLDKDLSRQHDTPDEVDLETQWHTGKTHMLGRVGASRKTKTVGHVGPSLGPQVNLDQWGTWEMELRESLELEFPEELTEEEIERRRSMLVEGAAGMNVGGAGATQLQVGAETDDEEDEEEQLLDWPSASRRVRNHLNQLQIIVEKALARKIFEAWPEVESAFNLRREEGVTITPHPSMWLTHDEFLVLLKHEDLLLNAQDTIRVCQRTYWGDEEYGDLTYKRFYEEWWPNEADRKKWEPLAIKKREERKAERAKQARERKAFEAAMERKRGMAIAMMRGALNNYMMTKGMNTPTERNEAKALLHKMLTLSDELEPPPRVVDLTNARSVIIEAHCSARGLDGLTVGQAAQITHNYAVERLCCYARGMIVRVRMAKMEAMFLAAMMRLARNVTDRWRKYASFRMELRMRCQRKMKVWLGYLQSQQRKRLYFKGAFWPFYVWHREAHTMRIARDKTVFLLRVVRVHRQLRVFRALQRFWTTKRDRRDKVAAHLQLRLHRSAVQSLADWHQFASVKAAQMLVWRTKGKAMRMWHQNTALAKYVAVWRYWASGRRLCTTRSFRYFKNKLTRKKVPAFPRLLNMPWAAKLGNDLGVACEPTWLKLVQRDRYMLRINALQYKRLAPLVFTAWVAAIDWKKKKRFATWRGAHLVMMKAFDALHRVAILQKQERLAMLTPAELEKQKELELERVHERQQQRKERDRAAREDYKRQWTEDQTKRVKAMKRSRERMLRLTDQVTDHRLMVEHREASELKKAEKAEGRSLAVRALLKEETSATEGAVEGALSAADNLRRIRARVLHDAMVTAIDQAEATHMQTVLKGVLRALRLPMLTKRSVHLYNRAKLRNWCRLCARFHYLWRAMPTYRRLRTKWEIFNRWLRLLAVNMRYETPGLAEEITRRREIAGKLAALLEGNKGYHLACKDGGCFKPGQPFDQLRCAKGAAEGGRDGPSVHLETPEAVGRAAACTPHALFLRWAELTQFRMCWRRMVCANVERGKWRTVQRVFYAWRLELKPWDTRAARGQHAEPFLIQRADFDIHKLRCRLLKFQFNQESYRIRRLWDWKRSRAARIARATPTLKMLLHHMREQTTQRMALERTLLLKAFARRGQCDFTDVYHEPEGGLSGEPFADEAAPAHTRISQIVLLEEEAVVGLSLVKVAAAVAARSPLRGGTIGKHCVFELLENEHLVRIEGKAGRVINRIRFLTSAGRWSRWFGKTDMGDAFVLGGDEEAGDTIVGLTGRATRNTLDALGAVVRQTHDKEVFSDSWLNSEQEIGVTDAAPTDGVGPGGGGGGGPPVASIAETQFAHMLRMRACDVEAALHRAQALAKNMYSSGNHDCPEQLASLAMIKGEWASRRARQRRGEELPLAPVRRSASLSSPLLAAIVPLAAIARSASAVPLAAIAQCKECADVLRVLLL